MLSTMASCLLFPICNTGRLVQRQSALRKTIYHGDKSLWTAIRCFSTLNEDKEESKENIVGSSSSFGVDSGDKSECFIDSGSTSTTGISPTSTTKATNNSNSLRRNKIIQTLAPPAPETFPSWSYEPRPFFHYELLYESKKSLARVGRIHTVRPFRVLSVILF